jgi:hypothetical protein
VVIAQAESEGMMELHTKSNWLMILMCIVAAVLIAVAIAHCQTANPQCTKESESQTLAVSGNTLTFFDACGTQANTFELVIAGGPATFTATLSGVMQSGTATSLATTSATTANQILQGSGGPYTKYTVTASWTGGASPSVAVNRLAAVARRSTGGATFPNALAAGQQLVSTGAGNTYKAQYKPIVDLRDSGGSDMCVNAVTVGLALGGANMYFPVGQACHGGANNQNYCESNADCSGGDTCQAESYTNQQKCSVDPTGGLWQFNPANGAVTANGGKISFMPVNGLTGWVTLPATGIIVGKDVLLEAEFSPRNGGGGVYFGNNAAFDAEAAKRVFVIVTVAQEGADANCWTYTLNTNPVSDTYAPFGGGSVQIYQGANAGNRGKFRVISGDDPNTAASCHATQPHNSAPYSFTVYNPNGVACTGVGSTGGQCGVALTAVFPTPAFSLGPHSWDHVGRACVAGSNANHSCSNDGQCPSSTCGTNTIRCITTGGNEVNNTNCFVFDAAIHNIGAAMGGASSVGEEFVSNFEGEEGSAVWADGSMPIRAPFGVYEKAFTRAQNALGTFGMEDYCNATTADNCAAGDTGFHFGFWDRDILSRHLIVNSTGNMASEGGGEILVDGMGSNGTAMTRVGEIHIEDFALAATDCAICIGTQMQTSGAWFDSIEWTPQTGNGFMYTFGGPGTSSDLLITNSAYSGGGAGHIRNTQSSRTYVNKNISWYAYHTGADGTVEVSADAEFPWRVDAGLNMFQLNPLQVGPVATNATGSTTPAVNIEQFANGADTIVGYRFTDSAVTGNLLALLNNGKSSTLFGVAASGLQYSQSGNKNDCPLTTALTLSAAQQTICSWTLPIPVAAGAVTYSFWCDGTYSLTAGTTPTLILAMSASQTPVNETATATIWSASTGTLTSATVSASASGSQVLLTGVTNIVANMQWHVYGTLQANTTTAGTFAITAAMGGTTPAGTVNVGSACHLH